MIISSVNNIIVDDTFDNLNNILELVVEAGTNDTDLIIIKNPLNKLGDDLVENVNRIKNNDKYLDEIKRYSKEYAVGVMVFYYDNKFNLNRLITNYKGINVNEIGINICDDLVDNSICFTDVDINLININKALIINEKNIIFYDNGIKDITDKKNVIIYAEF